MTTMGITCFRIPDGVIPKRSCCLPLALISGVKPLSLMRFYRAENEIMTWKRDDTAGLRDVITDLYIPHISHKALWDMCGLILVLWELGGRGVKRDK